MLHSFSGFIAGFIPGKVQKITVNAGFMCPNRNGEKGTGGCIYCNNASFTPGYALSTASISEQIERGKDFFSRKYPDMRYVVYFQSYTSTNAPVETLLEMYREALSRDKIVGIIIGTRPDCMPTCLLDELAALSKSHFVMIEYGAESANDSTLRFINRCHTWADTADAVQRTVNAGIPVGLHLILGLPGESRRDIFQTIDAVNELPVSLLKFHQMQIVKGTRLCQMVENGYDDFIHFTPDSYADFCIEIIDRLRKDISIERFVSQAPASLLVSPRWGLKNYQFTNLLQNKLRSR